MSGDRAAIPRRQDYPWRLPVQVRWNDFDMLGHINNVLYVRYYELMIAHFVAVDCGVRWQDGPAVPFVAESSCRFIRPIDCGPDGPVAMGLEGGLRVDRLGTSSVTYGVAIFEPGRDDAAATGVWVHVYVDRATQRPTPIPDPVRAAYQWFLAG